MTHSFPARRVSDLSADRPGRAELEIRQLYRSSSGLSFQQFFLDRQAIGIAAKRSVAAHDAVARDQHRHIVRAVRAPRRAHRSEEHTSELQSLMRISYAVFCLKKKITH